MKKIVLITGASSDIGSEIASLLGDSYEVILHYNNNYDEVMKLKDKLDKLYNTDVLVVKCNLAKEEEIDNMLRIIYDRYDKIDILINNAATTCDTLFEDKTKDNFMNTLDSKERENSDDYLSIMNEYLRNLREATTNE